MLFLYILSAWDAETHGYQQPLFIKIVHPKSLDCDSAVKADVSALTVPNTADALFNIWLSLHLTTPNKLSVSRTVDIFKPVLFHAHECTTVLNL